MSLLSSTTRTVIMMITFVSNCFQAEMVLLTQRLENQILFCLTC